MKRGFTFIELIIYIAITSMVVVTFIYFTLSISGSRATAYSSEEVQSNARMAMDYISQKIKNSTGASISSGALVLTTATLPITIDVSGGRLRTTQNSVSNFITSDETEITNLTFTNLTSVGADRENIRIDMTIRFRAAGDSNYAYTYSIMSSVGPRQ